MKKLIWRSTIWVRRQYYRDLKNGYWGKVTKNEQDLWLKYWLFPSHQVDVSADVSYKRKHISHTFLEKALELAAYKAGLSRKVTPHILRHCFATSLIQRGENIRTVQELLGHKSIDTTMCYLHGSAQRARNTISPFDTLPINIPSEQSPKLILKLVDEES